MGYHFYKGDNFKDLRGSVNFFNAFNMSEIVRMYEIIPASEENIRAWQGHVDEKKWFYCSRGSFIINLIKIDNFHRPSPTLKPEKIILEARKPTVLEISGGYVTGIKMSEKDSRLSIFSNFSLEDSKNDDFRYPLETWSFIF